MEKEEKQQYNHGIDLQWGKRLRRFKEPSKSSSFGITRRKMSTRLVSSTTTTTTATDPSFCLTRVTEGSRHGKSPSPDKEERYYTTRGSAAGDENGNGNGNGVGFGMGIGIGMGGEEKGKGNGNGVWPKLYVSLSSKEKEEDFLAMKGCKLPQRPKKRAKLIQRTLLLVSPGAWLTDMCQERYEVREKKTPKKRPRGLKAMGNVVDSDTE